MPDLFGWLLTGRRAGERTDASTTQLLDPRTGTWSDELCHGLGLPRAILPELIEPGSELGPLRPAVAEEIGLAHPVTVIARRRMTRPAPWPPCRLVGKIGVIIGCATGLVLSQLGNVVAAGSRGSASGDQRRNDEV